MSSTYTILLILCAFSCCSAKDLRRSKRQLQVYYMCNGIASQYPCSTSCQNNNCDYGSYNSYSNCNSGCSNLNCNQYNGQWINGQYLAYSMGNNIYSPCASTCCSSSNNYNPYGSNSLFNFNNIYQGGSVSTTTPTYSPYGTQSFPGTYKNGVYLCGGMEPSGGVCQNNGICPSGHSCIAGNVCCRCAVGASAGTCQLDSHCQSGYKCMNGNCCPSQISQNNELTECVNSKCIDGYTCGVGNLCYPNGFYI